MILELYLLSNQTRAVNEAQMKRSDFYGEIFRFPFKIIWVFVFRGNREKRRSRNLNRSSINSPRIIHPPSTKRHYKPPRKHKCFPSGWSIKWFLKTKKHIAFIKIKFKPPKIPFLFIRSLVTVKSSPKRFRILFWIVNYLLLKTLPPWKE